MINLKWMNDLCVMLALMLGLVMKEPIAGSICLLAAALFAIARIVEDKN